MAVCVTTECQI